MVNAEKVAQVGEYSELLKSAKSIYLADYIGLDVAGISELRKRCRDESVSFRVVKNRLMKLAAADAGLADLEQYLEGPTAVVISETDEVSPAKLIVEFAKKKKKPKLKAAVVDGEVFGPEEAASLAKLPTFNEQRAMLLSMINTPATQLVRLLSTPATQLARVVDARQEQGQE